MRKALVWLMRSITQTDPTGIFPSFQLLLWLPCLTGLTAHPPLPNILCLRRNLVPPGAASSTPDGSQKSASNCFEPFLLPTQNLIIGSRGHGPKLNPRYEFNSPLWLWVKVLLGMLVGYFVFSSLPLFGVILVFFQHAWAFCFVSKSGRSG